MLEKMVNPLNLGDGCAEENCWPNLGCALRRVVSRCRSRIHSEAGTGSSCSTMMQHYPITNAAAAVWGGASGPSFPVSAMLLIYMSCFSLLAMCTIVSSFSVFGCSFIAFVAS